MKNHLKRLIAIVLVFLIVFCSAPCTRAATVSESENNNNFSAADIVEPNGLVQGLLETTSDIDCYKITTPSNGQLNITFKHTYADLNNGWLIQVYFYSNGNYELLSEYDISLKDSETFYFPSIGAVAGGVYYIKVSNNYYKQAGYVYNIQTTFSSTDYFEKELNNNYTTATPMSLNQQYSGAISHYSDCDIYKITPTTTSTIPIIFYHTYYNIPYCGWYVNIYHYTNGSYEILKSQTIHDKDSDEYLEIYNLSAKANNTYYIKVEEGYYGASGNTYSLSIGPVVQTPITHTVTFEANSGNVSPTSLTVTDSESITLPTPEKYVTITYDANGGSGAPSAQSISVNCKGWSTSNSSSSANYLCGASYKPTADTTLYAVWNSSASKVIPSNTPSKSDYIFLGWSTNKFATTPTWKIGETITLSGNTTLYAVWQKITTTEPTCKEENVSMSYRDSMHFNGATSIVTSNSNIVSVYDGKITAVGTGSADVTVTYSDGNVSIYHINVSYTWWQWILIIVLFGWIWY